MIGWHGASMLCYVTPKEHLGLPNDKDVKTASSPTRSLPTPRRSRHRPGARDRDDALSYARYKFDWDKQFALSLDPETARAMHDETLPDDYYKKRFLLHVRPEILLDELFVKVDEYNKQVTAWRRKTIRTWWRSWSRSSETPACDGRGATGERREARFVHACLKKTRWQRERA